MNNVPKIIQLAMSNPHPDDVEYFKNLMKSVKELLDKDLHKMFPDANWDCVARAMKTLKEGFKNKQ